MEGLSHSFKFGKRHIISAITDLAIKILPKGSSITLFGSRARGNNRADSDWDLLILLDSDNMSNSRKGDIAYPFVELGWYNDVEINPIVHSFKEWEERKYLELYHNIQSEGIKIWE